MNDIIYFSKDFDAHLKDLDISTLQGKNDGSTVVINTNTVLLSTALVKAQKSDGEFIIFRALVDQGAQTSMITQQAAKKLSLPHKKAGLH
jgi:hypothetical protein